MRAYTVAHVSRSGKCGSDFPNVRPISAVAAFPHGLTAPREDEGTRIQAAQPPGPCTPLVVHRCHVSAPHGEWRAGTTRTFLQKSEGVALFGDQQDCFGLRHHSPSFSLRVDRLWKEG